jgi:hypothetical protein
MTRQRADLEPDDGEDRDCGIAQPVKDHRALRQARPGPSDILSIQDLSMLDRVSRATSAVG